MHIFRFLHLRKNGFYFSMRISENTKAQIKFTWFRVYFMIPGLGRTPGEGNGNPLQCVCLENSTDRAWQATYSPWGRKESDTTECLTLSWANRYHHVTEEMKAWNFSDPELKFQKDPLFYAIENDYKKNNVTIIIISRKIITNSNSVTLKYILLHKMY